GDFAEAHWHEPGLFLLEELANAGRRLPGEVAEIRPQSPPKKRVLAKGQPGVNRQVVEALDLLLESRVEGRGFHAAVREDDRTAVGNGADRLSWSNQFHSVGTPHSRDYCILNSLAALQKLERVGELGKRV